MGPGRPAEFEQNQPLNPVWDEPPIEFSCLAKPRPTFPDARSSFPRLFLCLGGAHKLGTSPPAPHQLPLKTQSVFGAYSWPRLLLVSTPLLPFSPSRGSSGHAYKRPFAASDLLGLRHLFDFLSRFLPFPTSRYAIASMLTSNLMASPPKHLRYGRLHINRTRPWAADGKA